MKVLWVPIAALSLSASLATSHDAGITPGQVDPDAFAVASVKPNRSRDGDREVTIAPGGRFIAQFATLRDLVQLAYPDQDGRLLNESRILSSAGWMAADRFDVSAKAAEMSNTFDAATTAAGAARADELVAVDRIRAMLRSLLAERFKLAVHTERQQRPVYALVLASRTGALGPRLRHVNVDCVALRERGQLMPPSRNQAPCGGIRGLSPGHGIGHAIPMPMIAQHLSGTDGRPVLDRTGLTGVFDVDLEWDPDGTTGPSLFAALQEQLGLKLEAMTDVVDVLIIDHAEPPTAD